MSGDESVPLAGTAWRLASIGDRPALDDVRSTIDFGTDGNVSGRGGVNRFFGGYRVATAGGGGTIEFGAVASTLMAGPQPAMDQEYAFLQALAGTVAFTVDGDTLRIGELRLRRLEQVTVTGRVAYRQRIALPPGAVVFVRVVDVSRADAPSVAIAEQRIDVEHQVPIPFELRIDADDLDPRRRYSVSARIEIDGELAWVSDTSHPVATDGPTDVEVNLVQVSGA